MSEKKIERKKYKQSPYQKKPKVDKNNLKEINIAIAQDLAEKLKEYRELVKARKIKEARFPIEPEIYHHFKK